MEKFQELGSVAKKKIQLADHMLTVTYPMVHDAKLLLVVLQNIFLGMSNAMGALLHYERYYKRVPVFSDNFAAKFHLFRDHAETRYNLDESYLDMVQTLRDIIVLHKKSPIEFAKKDKLVICSENYSIKTITPEQIKNYLNKAKLFIEEATEIIKKDGRISS